MSIATFFSGDAHDITHDIDGPLRDADLALAKELCLNVLELEIQLAGRYELDIIETAVTRSAELLNDGARRSTCRNEVALPKPTYVRSLRAANPH